MHFNAHTEMLERPPLEFQNAGASIRLHEGRCLIIGSARRQDNEVAIETIRHRSIELEHVAVYLDPQRRAWIVDIATDRSCVFVDGRRVFAGQLADGAVLQIGPLAWRYEDGKQVLNPVSPIAGFDLNVDAEVPGRLVRSQVRIGQGELTALVGPSGCGKSTLLETIRDGSGLRGEVDTSGRVFFVPQQDLVHQDLRLEDALRSIGLLFGQDVLPFQIDAALDAVGLPVSSKGKFPYQLSGGQLRRFRIAGALLSGAGVIVLDEPDSGLDHETATEVITLLRALAVRGATVVAVTHHRHVLALFDRVITMQVTPQGGQVDHRSGLQGQFDSIEADDSYHQDLESRQSVGTLKRFAILARREQKKLTSPRLKWIALGRLQLPSLLIGLLLVPLLFAAAVGVSVPTDLQRDVDDGLYGEISPIARLGFLAVVSVVWMSASASHLSITRDRQLSDYERSYGISWASFLSAKSSVLITAGLIQTMVFASLLYLIRYVWLDRSFFVDERYTQLLGVAACLLLVSVAATMTGLLVSAIAGRAPLVATAILPVIMMIQILFSAPFAVSNPDGYEPLADYDRLTVFASEDSASEADVDQWEDWEDDQEQAMPMKITSILSYATLSRYGDQWIRSFAVTTDPVEHVARVVRDCALALASIAGICFVATWSVLWMQTTRLGTRRLPMAMLALVIVMTCPGGAFAQQAESSREGGQAIEIRLRLVEGRYDENQLRAVFGAARSSSERWREFGNQDRLGLVALELVGKIEFQLSERELVIVLKETPKWDIFKQLAPPRLIGAETIGSGEQVVLFIHGLEGGDSTFAGAAAELKNRGIASMRFDYPNDGPPAEIADRLVVQMKSFAQQHPRVRVTIVAHSLGGLISTWAVTEPGFPVESVPHVFTLGTPFRGSSLAAFHDELELFDVAYRLATRAPGALNTIADGRGEAARALQPASPFLTALHRRRIPPQVQFHLAAGTKSFLPDSRRARLAASLPGELARLAVSSKYAERIDRLLSSEEFRQGRGDGAVTVDSALGLAGAAQTKTFPLSHTGLVSSTEPLEWVLQTAGLAEPGNPASK